MTLDQRGEISGCAEAVVASVHVDDEVFGRAHIDAERCRIEAIKTHACAVRSGGEDLGAVAAVDLRRVVAGAAFEQVGVVAGIPDHAVVTALAENLVVGVAAGQDIIAVTAEEEVKSAFAKQRVVAAFTEQLVAAGTAGDGVVAGAAKNVGARQGAVRFIERDGVVAAKPEHLDEAGIGDGRRCRQ